MERWELAKQRYDAAAAAHSDAANTTESESMQRLQTAMDELTALKREIDETIQQGRKRRLNIPGTLLMGTVEQDPLNRLTEEWNETLPKLMRNQH